MNTRALAVQLLNSFHYHYNDFEKKVADTTERLNFSQADQDFVYIIVKGVIQYRKLLEYILTFSLNKTSRRLEQTALNLLYIGALQRVILKTPEHALVYETVEAAKELNRPDLAPLVNGVLRNLPDEQTWRTALSQCPNLVERLAIEYSHPEWLVDRWLKEFGENDCRFLLEFNNSYQEIYFRHNPLRLSWNEGTEQLRNLNLKYQIVADFPLPFFTVNQPGALLKSEYFSEGGCSVQDHSQAFAVLLLDPKPGETIRDVCAAPGGKSTFIAQLVGKTVHITVSDISQKKITLIKNECVRLGIDFINYAVADASDERFPLVDKVLIDAPCTGTGVLSRRADLRWNRTSRDLDQLCRLQLKILENVSQSVKDGGAIVYSTCSIEPEENWGVIQQFIDRHPEFAIEPAVQYIDKYYCDESGAVMILPQKHRMTGGFAVRLSKV